MNGAVIFGMGGVLGRSGAGDRVDWGGPPCKRNSVNGNTSPPVAFMYCTPFLGLFGLAKMGGAGGC